MQYQRSRYYRDVIYRRRMFRCLLASCLFYIVVGHIGPSRMIPRAFRPNKLAMLGEDINVDNLSSTEFPIDEIREFISRRIARGAMVCIEYSIEDEIDMTEGPNPIPSVRIGKLVILTPPAKAEEVSTTPPPTIEVEFELDLDLATRNRSQKSSQTSEFGIVESFDPEYPDESLDSNVEGMIIFRIVVNPLGLVNSIELVENHTDRHCETATMMALREWVFKPLVIDGQPVWFSVQIPFSFEII